MSTELHLYIEIADNETAEQATNRTNEIIENLFSEYGFSIYEQDINECNDNEIKTYMSVDVHKWQIDNILNEYMYQIY